MIRKPKKNNPRDNNAYKTMTSAVRRRDRGKCQMPDCGKRGSQVHHIRRYADSGHGRLNPDNCILLCKICHTQVTGSEHIYASLFIKIVSQNNAKNNKRH